MAKKLTARKVEQARPNPSKRREIPDGGKPGLYLVIQPADESPGLCAIASTGDLAS